MSTKRRLIDTIILAACIPAIAPVLAAIVVAEIGASLRELAAGDRAGLWGSR